MTVSAVHSYDEWSHLRQVIVGRAEGYGRHHLDTSFALFFFENIYQPVTQSSQLIGQYIDLPARVLNELEEDIEEFVLALKAADVEVLRPAVHARQVPVVSPLWKTLSSPALNVRDQTLILGDTIIETSPHVRGRIFENDFLKPVFYDYFQAGSRWLTMPRPTLGRGTLDESYFEAAGLSVEAVLTSDDAGAIDGLGHEIVFDGAQCVRFGKDVLVNVGNQNHALALEWLVRNFSSDFVFHRLDQMADNHIDSIIMPLRPGLLLLRSPAYRSFLPDALRKWDCIYAPEVSEARFPIYESPALPIASRYVDMNVLSIDERTVVVNSLYPELIEALDAYGFEVVPVRHRHRRLFGGGFHCFTLDCVRDGGLENYL